MPILKFLNISKNNTVYGCLLYNTYLCTVKKNNALTSFDLIAKLNNEIICIYKYNLIWVVL
jgi:hypothetical protein